MRPLLPASVLILTLAAALPGQESSLLERCRVHAPHLQALPELFCYTLLGDPTLEGVVAAASAAEIEACLADEDPRVRTLGVVALSERGEAALLPMLWPLVADESPTFDLTLPNSVALLEVGGKFVPSHPPTRREPATVGRIAGLVLDAWLDDQQGAVEGDQGFPESVDPEHLGTVWVHRLRSADERARVRIDEWSRSYRSDGSLQAREEWKTRCQDEFARCLDPVLQRLAELPGRVQVLIVLGLTDRAREHWDEEWQRRMAARLLPPDTALSYLRGEPSDDLRGTTFDPWLNADPLPGPQRAGELLEVVDWQPCHASALIALEDRPGYERISSFVTAAARALNKEDPAGARRMLRQAFSRFPERYQDMSRSVLAARLWSIAGLEEEGFLRERFYLDDELYSCGGSIQEVLPGHVARSAGQDARSFLGLLLADDRFSELTWSPLTAVARAVNTVHGEPVISERELTAPRHPLGAHSFSRLRAFDRVMELHPAETEALLRTLEGWRTRLREHVARAGW